MNTLALIGGGFLILIGLIVATARLAARVERERIQKWLAEQAFEQLEGRTKSVMEQRTLSHGEWKKAGRNRRGRRKPR